jgi:hypothetical protein
MDRVKAFGAALLVAGGIAVGVYFTGLDTVDPTALRVATCPVRLREECRGKYPDMKRYETVRLPVAMLDGGVPLEKSLAIALPDVLADCVEVLRLEDCAFEDCAKTPGACDVKDAGLAKADRAASKYVIPDCRAPDGGWDDSAVVDCRRAGVLLDGGAAWWGCNVFPRAEAVGTQCLDAPTGVVVAGERLEDSL